MLNKAAQQTFQLLGVLDPDVMVGALDHAERRIRKKLRNLFDRPAWADIPVAVQKECRAIQARYLLQQRWALDVLLRC